MASSASAVCPACGEPLREGSVFCQHCGAPIPSRVILEAIGAVSAYRGVTWRAGLSTLDIDASSPEGFHVGLSSAPAETLLYFGSWHDHFPDPNDALDLFRRAISGQVRLAETSRCGIPYKWEVQELAQNGGWKTRFTAGLLIPVLLPRRRTRYLLNRFALAA